MDDNLHPLALAGNHAVGRKMKPERFRQRLPVGIPMDLGSNGIGKKHLAAPSWKPIAPLRPRQGHQDVVARIPAGGNGGIEILSPEGLEYVSYNLPRPLVQPVLASENGPGSNKGNDTDARPKARTQLLRKGLGNQRDLVIPASQAKKGCGNSQVPHSP